MKKTKIEQRFKNALDAFFDVENSGDSLAMSFVGNQEVAPISSSEKNSQIADKYFGLFKKVFAFLPGVLFLHSAVPAAIEFGFGIWGLFWLAAGIFMVWAGIGELNNKKHFLLPLSVMSVALIFALPFGVLPLNLLNYYFYFYIGILPLCFIAPILTKSYLDKI